MSYEKASAVNMIAGEDLRGDLFELLTIENDGDVGKVIKAASATAIGVGVLAEEPRADASTDGENVPVVILDGSIVLMKAGGAITAGNIVVPTTTAGRVGGVAGTGALADDQMGVGIALESAVDGDVFQVLGMPIAAPHAA